MKKTDILCSPKIGSPIFFWHKKNTFHKIIPFQLHQINLAKQLGFHCAVFSPTHLVRSRPVEAGPVLQHPVVVHPPAAADHTVVALDWEKEADFF